MRILRVITRLNIGGPSIQAISLTTRLAERGHATTLIHGRLDRGEGDMTYLAPPGASLTYVAALCRPIALANDLHALFALKRLIKEFKPDIVHTHMAKAGMLGRLAALAFNVGRPEGSRARVVHTYHGHVLEGYFGAAKTATFIMLERMLARCSDAIIAISPAIRQELLDHHRIGHADQYRIVPLGFDLSAFAAIDDQARALARQSLGIDPHAHVITTVGRLTAIKQHGLFLDTFARVASQDPAAIALVVGDGELRSEVDARAAALGITDRVRMLGWRKDLATINAATDVFLLTSRNEGTPVALIEAMASAVPGVSTDVGGVKDVIPNRQVGRLAPFGDAGALAAAVLELLSDDRLRRELGTAARAHVLERYSVDRLVDDIDLLYQQLTQRRH
jgi:glycosyltransferase involved in cell wall biosynthesis